MSIGPKIDYTFTAANAAARAKRDVDKSSRPSKNLSRFGKNGSNNGNQKSSDKNHDYRPNQITANSSIPTRE